ncbi:MAG: hypothetical protein ACJAZ2_001195 [Glaciecola sp.]|jgi:hypothetical protein
MKKIIITFNLIALVGFSSIAQVFDFNDNFAAGGWTYYDDFGSSPNAAFEYDSSSSRFSYNMNKSTETSILYAALSDSIGGYGSTFTDSYSASFKITPSGNQYNGVYPLILSENLMTGEHRHPWRNNPTNPSIAGTVNDNDMIAVLLSGNAVNLLSKKDASTVIWQEFDTAFTLTSFVDYWIQIKSTDTNTVSLSVFSDSLLTSVLITQDFVVNNSLAAFKYVYVANSNGNTATNSSGHLDNYRISKEISTGIVSAKTQSFSAYPNPADNTLNVVLEDGQLNAVLSIINQTGQVVIERTITNNAAINVADLTSGAYHVRVVSSVGTSSTTVLIK